ncbi:MAG: hypothetical protein ACD_54C00559G0001 [uncultured bacterium]|nr:MAG: hypothetical protein ACD_54C00559G0001 [uncultured bacterium]
MRQNSSVTTWVRSIFTPKASSPRFSILPTIPTAEITVSNSCVVAPLASSRCATTLPGERSSFFTVVFSRIVMPCLTKAFLAKALISASSTGSTRSITSTTVVSAPKVLKKLANSMPIAPEPITSSFFGIRLGCSAWRYVQTRSPSASSPGNSRARAPVARMIDLAVNSSVPLSVFTDTTPAFGSVAAPMNTVTLFFFIR